MIAIIEFVRLIETQRTELTAFLDDSMEERYGEQKRTVFLRFRELLRQWKGLP